MGQLFSGGSYAGTIALAQTALVTFLVMFGLTLVLFAEPPTRFWVGGDVYNGDKRHLILVAVLFVAFLVIAFVPFLRNLFQLAAITIGDLLITGVVATLCALLL